MSVVCNNGTDMHQKTPHNLHVTVHEPCTRLLKNKSQTLAHALTCDGASNATKARDGHECRCWQQRRTELHSHADVIGHIGKEAPLLSTRVKAGALGQEGDTEDQAKGSYVSLLVSFQLSLQGPRGTDRMV